MNQLCVHSDELQWHITIRDRQHTAWRGCGWVENGFSSILAGLWMDTALYTSLNSLTFSSQRFVSSEGTRGTTFNRGKNILVLGSVVICVCLRGGVSSGISV